MPKKKSTPTTNPNLEQIILLGQEWEPIETTTRKASILASNVAMSITGGIGAGDYNQDTLGLIYKNVLPPYMAWDYWVLVNQWTDYWINRYQIETEFEDLALCINQALRNAILFGSGIITKGKLKKDTDGDNEWEEPLAGAIIEREVNWNGQTVSGKYTPTALSMAYQTANPSGNGIDWSDKAKQSAKPFKLKDNNCVCIDWRYNRIGDFVWCLKDILIEIYLKRIIEVNSSNLLNKMFVDVRNPNNLATELAINRNPFTPIGIRIVDSIVEDPTNTDNKFNIFTSNKENNLATLNESLKQHMEYYYGKYGRQISSTKDQSLSSDAVLSVNNARAIANEHDWRVKTFIKEINEMWPEANVQINVIDDEQQESNREGNENADKEGEAKANTEGDKNKKKAD